MNYAIIAAGEGSRLAAEGVESPKPLVRLGGKTLLERLAGIFMSCGAESISIIVSERSEEVIAHARQIAAQVSVPVRVVVKTTPDSMHSFAEATAGFKGKFCVTTVDTVFNPAEFAGYIKAFEADTLADGYMAVTAFVDDEKPLFVATDASMNITSFRDKAAADTRFVSGGIYGLDDKALKVLDACLANGTARMRNFQRALITAGLRLKAYPLGKVIDIDHASDIAVAEALLQDNNQSISGKNNG